MVGKRKGKRERSSTKITQTERRKKTCPMTEHTDEEK